MSDAEPPRITVEDTTESWCLAFFHTLLWTLDGWPMPIVDVSQVRPEGAWLHTKGGRASGPAPLIRLLETSHQVIAQAGGRALTPFEVHRLATLCGSIVQVGGVRRAAEIALFSEDDQEMLECKNGNFWEQYPELAMANNSVVFDARKAPARLTEVFTNLALNGTGEPGFFNRAAPIGPRRERRRFGTNPCGEILLRSRQFCNLSIAVARPLDTFYDLTQKVKLAATLGTIQSCLTKFNFIDERWAQHTRDERLLGVDITGVADCGFLQRGNYGDATIYLERLRNLAVEANAQVALQLGIAPSAAVTCNKPSGNSSQLLGVSSGIHPRYSRWYLRRLRLGARSPLALRLVELGIPVFPEVAQGTLEQASVWVFEIPVASPVNSVVREQVSALDQLEEWLKWKVFWTEHNPSCTIYVKSDEWLQVQEFVREHFALIGGLSFLPADNTVYELAPYEAITEEEYHRRVQQLPASLHLETLREDVDGTSMAQDYSCVGGLCEI
jgi:ribonucleoside-diphosphate reductase alpha chain